MKQPKRDAKESTEETAHKCGECGMVFPRRYAFIMHTLKHERARDYKCPVSTPKDNSDDPAVMHGVHLTNFSVTLTAFVVVLFLPFLKVGSYSVVQAILGLDVILLIQASKCWD